MPASVHEHKPCHRASIHHSTRVPEDWTAAIAVPHEESD
jgi:hypothetical protein